MATIDPETRRNPSHAEEDSNYLYHKQPRGIPRRHSGSHRNEDDANRRFTERNVARETFWRNIRTFAFMILAMLVFLGLAFHISRKNWADKQTRIRQQGQVAQVSTAHPTVLNLTPRGTPPPVREAMPQEPTEAVKTKAELVLKRARAFELSGNYEEAIERYRQAVVLWNAIPGGWTELARAHAHQGQLSQARDAYVQALQYEPGNTALINELAMIYLQHGQTAKAITTLSQAIESDPLYVQSYINLSLCHLSMRDMKEAEEVLTACVDRFPDNAQALKDLAYIKASNGDYNTALNILDHAIEANPESGPLYFDAAATCALMGRPEAAFSYLERALDHSTLAELRSVLRQPAFTPFLTTEKGRAFMQLIAEQEPVQEPLTEEHHEN